MAQRPRMRPPFAMVEKAKGGRLVPVAPYDAVLVEQAKPGAVFDLVPRRGRSNPQLKFYFGVLDAVVQATGAWPTASHLHEILVRRAGFIVPVLDPFTGTYVEERDSISFESMTQEEMNLYVDTALAKLSAALGIDVLDMLPKKEGRP